MAYCTNCGSPVEENGRFCASCGLELGHGSRRRWLLLSVVVVLVLAVAAGGVVLLVRSSGKGSASTAAKAIATARHSPGPSTSTSESFASLYSQDKSGVVKILTSTCNTGGEGTGFVIGRRLIATVAHVVSGQVAMIIKSGTSTYTGRVIGIDNASDVALIRTGEPMSGHVFHFATTPPAVGDELAVVGYPLNGPLNFSSGSVSGLNRRIEVAGQVRTGLLQTDAAINPGNSGGPLIDGQGSVDGLVDALLTGAEGFGYAVTASTAAPLLQSWQASPAPPAPPNCGQPVTPAPPAPTTDAYDTVAAYFRAIDAKDWRQVWNLGGDNLGTSYRSMVDGYANTARDDAFIYKVDGPDVDVALLATEYSGVAQVYLGQYAVEDGTVIAGHQVLQSTDSGSGFSGVAGEWEGHGRYVLISNGGTGIIAYRSYTWCSDNPRTGCDGLTHNEIVDGGLTTFRLTSADRDTASGRFEFSTTGLSRAMSVQRDTATRTLLIPRFGDVSFCKPASQNEGLCGA